MFSAVYYPHSSCRNEKFLTTALLFWDKVTFIAPHKNFDIARPHRNRTVSEALSLIGEIRVPNDSDKHQVHLALEDLLSRPNVDDFLLEKNPYLQSYEIFEEKLFSETWRMLRKSNLSTERPYGNYQDWAVGRNLGISIMSLLAKCIAGNSKQTVSDVACAHDLLAGTTVGFDTFDHLEELVSLSVDVTEPKHRLLLENAVEFRRMEKNEKEGGRELRRVRHAYVGKIQETMKEIANAKTEDDIAEYKEQFRDWFEGDLLDMKKELNDNMFKSFFAKDSIGFLTSIPLSLTPMGPSALLAGGMCLASNMVDFRTKRDAIVAKHPSFLFYTFVRKASTSRLIGVMTGMNAKRPKVR